ncbi:MAG TPA: murein biosynthesis integral membrane protein MurJ [Methylococcaceae bacterium]|nr:murein biosynthesis integral membrane protein MurJ [Methylococcaceae bacterium]
MILSRFARTAEREPELSRQLLKSTAVVSGMTLISRILGFVRDMVVAHAFGAGAASDAFFVAFRIPNFLRRLFAEGAFSQAFVPVLSDYKENNSHADLKGFLDRTGGSLAVVLMMVTALGMIAAPLVIWLFAPGFARGGEKYELAVEMLRITFPYLFFISLTAFASGILNTFGRFAIPALTPAFLNLCMIAAALWLAPVMDVPILALAWGVCAAGLVQFLFQAPSLWRIGALPRLRWGFHDPGVMRVMRLMGPALFGVSVTQVNLLVSTILASFLATGSVSWLYYSDRLMEFPVGMFGVALGTVVLPVLSRSHAGGKPEAFSNSLDWALRWVLLIGMPASVGLALLAEPLLSALFEYREFTASDVHMAGQSLMAYTVGMLGFLAVKVLVPGFSSRQDTRTPVRYGMWSVAANIVLNVSLAPLLAHVGLALSTALAALINAGLLLQGLLKRGVYRPLPGWGVFLSRVLLANLAMALFLFLMADMAQWAEWRKLERVWRLAFWVAGGAGAYLLCLILSGLAPRHVLRRESA